jgi:hypothetical protein
VDAEGVQTSLGRGCGAWPVAGVSRTGSTERCETDSPSVYANFDGPIAQSALVADYRQRAAELGWHETGHDDAILLNFEGETSDGTAILVRVYTYSPIKDGVVSQFTVDVASLVETSPSATVS